MHRLKLRSLVQHGVLAWVECHLPDGESPDVLRLRKVDRECGLAHTRGRAVGRDDRPEVTSVRDPRHPEV